MSRLPVELYRPIITYVHDRADLLSLLTTSWALSREAERLLYFSICDLETPSPISTYEHLASNSRQALLVHELYVYEPTYPFNNPQYWSVVAQALQQTKRLKYLSIYGLHSSPSWILAGCSFQLNGFDCQLEGSETFFVTQKQLRKLSWILEESSSRQVHIPPSALPSLSTLSSNVQGVHALLPGRPVKRLNYYGELGHADAMGWRPADCVAEELEVLRFPYDQPVPRVSELVEFCPNLLYIELSVTDLDGTEVMPVIAKLSQLQMIFVHKILSSRTSPPDLPFVQEVFRRSTSMKYVQVDASVWPRDGKRELASRRSIWETWSPY